jgi:phage terminase small subunit
MNAKMDVVSINKGKSTLMVVPAPPAHLSTGAKKGYLMMGKFLAQAERLKSYYLPTLEIFAVAFDQWQWACKAINEKNKHAPGTGFIQTFKTGATNITTEMTVRNDAADTMMKTAKLFGLDPKSEKELVTAAESGQLDLFKQLLELKNA